MYFNEYCSPSFRYSGITLREVGLPPIVVSIHERKPSYNQAYEDTKNLAIKGHSIYSTVLEHLCRLRNEIQFEALERDITKYMDQLQVSLIMTSNADGALIRGF